VKPSFFPVVLLVSAVLVQQRGFDPVRRSLPRESVQPIYAADTANPWNQVFFDLFTRTVAARLLPDGVTPFQILTPGSQETLGSARRVTRIESGDRAIDPLYSSWIWMGSAWYDMSSSGAWGVLDEPRYSHLLAALSQVEATAATADPLHRALMQSDLWAAYDTVYAGDGAFSPRAHSNDVVRRERSAAVLQRLRAVIRALALPRIQIAALPDNLADAASRGLVPNLLDPGAGWIEVRWFPRRIHEDAVQDRRAARVFLKPKPGQDVAMLLPRLRDANGSDLDAIEGAALVMQVLLLADDGTVVPSHLTYDLQMRRPGGATRPGSTFEEFELSRRMLLEQNRSGGLVSFNEESPAYLAIAGNDLSFATMTRAGGEAVVAPLRDRCAACHERTGRRLITFAMTFAGSAPAVERLDPSEDRQAREVAARKMARDDFRSMGLRVPSRHVH